MQHCLEIGEDTAPTQGDNSELSELSASKQRKAKMRAASQVVSSKQCSMLVFEIVDRFFEALSWCWDPCHIMNLQDLPSTLFTLASGAFFAFLDREGLLSLSCYTNHLGTSSTEFVNSSLDMLWILKSVGTPFYGKKSSPGRWSET